jgi:hypothetical protein
MTAPHNHLFIVSKKHLDRQPSITTNLEPIRQSVQFFDLLICQLPTLKLKVRLNTLLVDGLRDHRPAFLKTPCEQHLLWSLAFRFGDCEKGLIRVEGRVGAAEAGVAGAVNSF